MILPDSTYQEIYATMRSEKEKADYAFKRHMEKVWKLYRNQPWPSFSHCETYRVPSSRNTYLLWYHIESKGGGQSTMYGGHALMCDNKAGQPVYYVCKNFSSVFPMRERYRNDVLLVYTGHFFSRFRERAGIPDSIGTRQMIAYYFARNLKVMVPLDEEAMILKSNRYRDRTVWQVNDGIVFSTTTEETHPRHGPFTVSIQNTFITESMLKADQEGATLPKDAIRLLHRIIKEL